ncbi:YdcH family protein [Roseibium sediminis]|uniref:YdcH family protein n=1 Tax=Roseibium sediminis TaxID=1775174 RepID=UPI00123D0EF6|nr:YdcH family protein [Roseibium sediminis]
MSHVPHELHEEFPDQVQAIHNLKTSDNHFARLANEYHEVNREIHRIEAEIQPTSDDVLEDFKKKRLHLKDQIAAMLAAAENAGT